MCKIVALLKIEKTQLNKRGEAAIENSKYVCMLHPPPKKKPYTVQRKKHSIFTFT